jgi:hypothetical protein
MNLPEYNWGRCIQGARPEDAGGEIDIISDRAGDRGGRHKRHAADAKYDEKQVLDDF